MITKPPKPYPSFELFPHAKGYWCKTIAGRHKSFGKWEWPDRDAYERSWRAALDRLRRFQEDVTHGRRVVGCRELATARDLVDHYLTWQHGRATGKVREITAAHFCEVKRILTTFRDFVGASTTIGTLEAFDPMRPRDNALVRYLEDLRARYRWCRHNKVVAVLVAMWTWAEDPVEGLLGRPFRLKRLLRKHGGVLRLREKRERDERRGKQLWTADEVHALLGHAPRPLRVMLDLMLFCAYGNSDCADLDQACVNFDPDAAVGLAPGWALVHFPRPKTEIERAAVLPPFVVADLKSVVASRPAPAEPRWRGRVFLTRSGVPWVRDAVHENPDRPGVIDHVTSIDCVGGEFARLRDQLGRCPVHGWFAGGDRRGAGFRSDVKGVTPSARRPRPPASCPVCDGPLVPMRRLGAYTFRHTAITWASGAADVDALHLFEGHAIPGVRRRYIEELDAGKLLAIAERLLAKLRSFKPAQLSIARDNVAATTAVAVA
jgi:integrase